MNLRERMELAGRCLLAWLDPEKDFLPVGGYEVAHDIGRWWDAMLRLQANTGFAIPSDLEAAMLRNLKRFTANPDGWLMNRRDLPWLEARINPHNLREGMLAFNALFRYRQNAWARRAGHRLLASMRRCLQEDGRLDFARLASWGKVPLTTDPSHTETLRNGWFDGTATTGRSLEAIIWFYEITNDPIAVDVANRIAQHHLANSTCEDGSIRPEIIDPENVGHDHSYLGTLRGLLRFGFLMRQREFAEVVNWTLRKGLPEKIVKESGWAPHDLGTPRFSNADGDPVADPASAGDAVQLALWLALEVGQVDLLDDAERLIRSRLLPAQIAEEDVRRNPDAKFGPKQLGGWGCHGPAHAGKQCILDVTAAVLHTLCDVYSHIWTHDNGIKVYLHFDRKDPHLEIVSRRTDEATLSVRTMLPDNVFIRVPGWAPPESVRLTVNGKPAPLNLIGPFAWISRDLLREGSEIVLRHALPERTTTEEMPGGRRYEFKWRGDEIVGVRPNDQPLPFYPRLEDSPPFGPENK